MTTVHYIRGRGNPPSFQDIYEEVRWLEFVYCPGQTLENRVEVLRNTSKKYPFSIYKTHYSPKEFSIRDDAFYIVQVRNPIDALASLVPFMRSHSPEFAKMWGGFPPFAGEEAKSDDMIEFEKLMLEGVGVLQPALDNFMLNIILGFWNYRHHKNVLFVHYTDRIKDNIGQIERIAKFIGVQLTDDELSLVANSTAFETMKKNASRYNLQHAFDMFKESGQIPSEVSSILSSGNLVDKGPARDGNKDLPQDFVRRAKIYILKRTGPEIYKWLMEGGVFPINAKIPENTFH